MSPSRVRRESLDSHQLDSSPFLLVVSSLNGELMLCLCPTLRILIVFSSSSFMPISNRAHHFVRTSLTVFRIIIIIIHYCNLSIFFGHVCLQVLVLFRHLLAWMLLFLQSYSLTVLQSFCLASITRSKDTQSLFIISINLLPLLSFSIRRRVNALAIFRKWRML